MEHIPTSDLNRRMSEVLNRILAGERIVLTRYGKPVALISPIKATDLEGSTPLRPQDIFGG